MINTDKLESLIDEVIEAKNEGFERFDVRNPSEWTDEYVQVVKQNLAFMGAEFTFYTDGVIEFKD